ncbi:conserved exported protein of unknown function [Chlorella sorokiniana]|uniref:Uncharacterized protein n=1 Tax=Chlorella sorokiniana TaxID=3076 RepID=A0A2P6TZD4_CHLSO|nr:conserved exported protein of unknown function [Chlorella sorokiniana]|eukprot:PRW59427.1 conserved exported protein of unknown function [Chlorella sorokiniana]
MHSKAVLLVAGVLVASCGPTSAARMPSEAPLRGARKLLQSGAYVCVRPLNILPGDFLDTAALVHCYLQQGSGTAPAWSIAYSKEGTHAEFDTDHSKRQCHAVQGASLKAVQDASYFQIRHGPWGVADYEILDNNCCHFVDQILLDAGSSGVESYFPS